MLSGHQNAESRESVEDPSVPAAITDTGCERDLNEDRYAVIESPVGVCWVVCDGMGGVTGGELAAQLAIDAMRRVYETMQFGHSGNAAQVVNNAILEANRVIVLRRQNPAFTGMGTTVVAAHFYENEVAIGHAGDSRAYLIRDGAIQQLTIDDTYVQQLVDTGKISADEALSHPQAHVLTRCIGSEPGLEVHVDNFWIWPQPKGSTSFDYLLLCSDGLYSLVSEAEIASAISTMAPQKACVKLVELAKSRGGYDNITLAVIPLAGQLRKNPPEGLTGRSEAKSGNNHNPAFDPTMLKKIFLGLVICLLLGIVTALITAVVLSK